MMEDLRRWAGPAELNKAMMFKLRRIEAMLELARLERMAGPVESESPESYKQIKELRQALGL